LLFYFAQGSLKFKPMLLNQKLELGSNATIRCRADGQVTPRVRWSKVGQTDLSNHIRDVEGSLHFTKVLSTDAGEYVCTASSEQGIINVTVRIDVVGKNISIYILLSISLDNTLLLLLVVVVVVHYY